MQQRASKLSNELYGKKGWLGQLVKCLFVLALFSKVCFGAASFELALHETAGRHQGMHLSSKRAQQKK
jgi:hypothetical protein